jgi:beta-glucanase (GH16 family)
MLARYLLPAAAALFGLATAQVHTDCNPMERDDCPSNPALGTEHSWNFNVTPHNELWEQVVGPMTYDNENGAKFTISKQGESPTIRTKFYFFFGRVEFMLKAASGQGIVSSMMLLSDNLDEIDWEFIGTNTSHGSTNFFGKGIEDYTNGEWHGMPVSPQDDFHNYTTIWTEEKMDFYIDENLVRTIIASETSHEGNDTYPQTPMRMSLGIWAGGDPSLNEWTREWAGGDTNFDEAPFNMYVKSARIEDYSSGKEYVWGDRSGDWESIEVVE